MIVVSGSPRAGSSLMMRILRDSGFVPIADEPGSFESKLVANNDLSELDSVPVLARPSTCVKVFYPTIMSLPPRDYTVIWMYRTPKEQAKSQRKYYRLHLKVDKPRSFIGERAKSLKRINRDIPKILALSHLLIVKVSFEDLITHTTATKRTLERVLGRLVDTSCVVKRSPLNKNTMAVGQLETSSAG